VSRNRSFFLLRLLSMFLPVICAPVFFLNPPLFTFLKGIRRIPADSTPFLFPLCVPKHVFVTQPLLSYPVRFSRATGAHGSPPLFLFSLIFPSLFVSFFIALHRPTSWTNPPPFRLIPPPDDFVSPALGLKWVRGKFISRPFSFYFSRGEVFHLSFFSLLLVSFPCFIFAL